MTSLYVKMFLELRMHGQQNAKVPRRTRATSTGYKKMFSCATKLPDGRKIRCISRRDVPFLYREIFRDKCYLKHGVGIRPGDIVFDVGANIGLFALFASEICGSHGKVYAFEPLPNTYEALRHNLDLHVVEGYGSVEAFQVGLSDGKRTRATFIYYESAAGWSTMSPDEQEVRVSMERYLDNVLSKPKGPDNTWTAGMGRMLARYAPRWLFDVSKDIFVSNMLNRRQEVTCSLTSVSEQMRIHGLTRIDLLKVDVERAELDVLRGVQVEDWPNIRQCVIEVHDMRNRGVQEVCTLMKEVAGFTEIAVQQDVDLKGTGLYNVFCHR